MNVDLSDDRQHVTVTGMVTLPDGSITLFEAADLLQGLIAALNEAGVARTVWKVPEQKLTDAANRVIHMRKAHQDKAWNDRYVAQDIVMRVLEACL